MRKTHTRRSFACLCPWFVGALAIVMVAIVTPAMAATDKPVVDVTVLEDSQDRILLDYSFGDFGVREVKIDDEAWMVIDLGKESHILRAGAPDIPNVARSVIIPGDAAVSVNVVDADYYDVTDVFVAPSKGNLLRTVDPADVPFAFDKEIYAADAFYPGTLAELGDPYIMRDQRGVVVRVNPFQYNPATNVLRVYTSMTVEVVNDGPGGINPLPPDARKSELSLAFHQMYKHHFLNYGDGLRYPPMDETGDMLVICNDAWMTNAQPFVDHKNAIGISTTMVGVSTIGNNSTAIKNYIQNVYNTSDLAFVVLVGDAEQVATGIVNGGESDSYYSKLAGSDNYPDIIVGRFSAGSASDVDTQVQRTIEYENMPAVDQTWFWKGVGIGSAEGAGIGDEGQADYVHIGEIRTWLLADGYTDVDEFYDPGATDTQVRNAVNAGRGIINYCGHGWESGWSTTGFDITDVNGLTNDNVLPFIISVACLNADFGGKTCFGEAWLRATHNGEPTGAVGVYASSVSCSWAPPMEMQDEFNLLYTDSAEPYHAFGTMCYAGSSSSIDDYGSDGVAILDEYVIFGDPSLRIIGTVEPPTGLGVSGGDFNSSGPLGGPFTPDSATYTLTNHAAFPIDYEVTADIGWVDITNAGGTLSAGATVDVVVSFTSAVNGFGGGLHEGTVSFTNLTDHDGDTTKAVSLDVDARALLYDFNMDTNPGWTTQGLWAWGHPTGGGGQYGNPDPSNGYTGSNVYGYNLNGDYENNLPERNLTTTALDCSDVFDVTLKFRRWLGVEQPTYDHAYVRVSNDGSTWTTIWQNAAETTDSSWSLQEFDISSVADGQSTVYIRWTMGTTDSSWQFCGWNIDDVEIWAASNAPVAGDVDQDGDVDITDLGILLANYGMTSGATWADGDMDGDGDVDLEDLGILLANYGYGV